MEGLFGSDFEIDISKSKSDVKKLIKKLDAEVQAKDSTEKVLKSKKLSMQERLEIIRDRVIKVLGKQRSNTVVIRDLNDFSAYIDKAIEKGFISVDTETNNSLDPITCKLMGLCLYVPGERQAYIPVNHIDFETGIKLPNQITEEQIRLQLQRIKDSKIFVVMHNGKFDYEVVKCTCTIDLPPDWDTMVGAHLIDEEERAGLKDQYINKIDSTQAKYDIEKLFENIQYAYVDPEIFALYAATDSMMTYKLYEYQKAIFEAPGNEKLYWLFKTIEMPCVVVTAEMELEGVAVDQEFAKKLKAKYDKQLKDVDEAIEKELERLKPQILTWRTGKKANEKSRQYQPKKSKKSITEIEKAYPEYDEKLNKRYKWSNKTLSSQLEDPINLASPGQLAILFYDVLETPAVSKKKPRGTGKDELKAIAEKTKNPLCKLLLKRRGIEKLITTYIDVIPTLAAHWPDGRIRFHLNNCGTNTGRYSSGGKIKYMDEKTGEPVTVSGINIQNIPRSSIRNLFVARVNHFEIMANENSQYIVPEITELKTVDGYRFCRDIKATDLIDTGVYVVSIEYNKQLKQYSVVLNDVDYRLQAQTRYRIVGSDYSAQEPRLTTHISDDPGMRKAYTENKDLYAIIAQSAYNNEYHQNLEFVPTGYSVEIDGKEVYSGDGQEYEVETNGNTLEVDCYMLIPTDKGDIQADQLQPNMKVLGEVDLIVKSVETIDKKTTIIFEV